jgi:hypothetical protein
MQCWKPTYLALSNTLPVLMSEQIYSFRANHTGQKNTEMFRSKGRRFVVYGGDGEVVSFRTSQEQSRSREEVNMAISTQRAISQSLHVTRTKGWWARVYNIANVRGYQ